MPQVESEEERAKRLMTDLFRRLDAAVQGSGAADDPRATGSALIMVGVKTLVAAGTPDWQIIELATRAIRA